MGERLGSCNKQRDLRIVLNPNSFTQKQCSAEQKGSIDGGNIREGGGCGADLPTCTHLVLQYFWLSRPFVPHCMDTLLTDMSSSVRGCCHVHMPALHATGNDQHSMGLQQLHLTSGRPPATGRPTDDDGK
jgi:hypothetical protein